MRILLDTHIALWALVDSPSLSKKAKALILAPKAEIYVSSASVWEISIKHGLGRGNMPISGRQAIDFFAEAGYSVLPISAEHAAFTEELPPYHADPFDRLLLAQAICEPLRLISHDATLARYSDIVILV